MSSPYEKLKSGIDPKHQEANNFCKAYEALADKAAKDLAARQQKEWEERFGK